MQTLLLYSILCIISFLPSFNLNAQKGKDGSLTITSAGYIANEYTFVTSDINPGSKIFNVQSNTLNSNNRFSTVLSSGDFILILQMQGALIKGNVQDSTWGEIIDYSNCGLYELHEVKNILSNNQIEVACEIVHSYSSNGNTQVIRIPRLSSLEILSGGELTAESWNGKTGGICAVEVEHDIIIHSGGEINVSAKGFRGGAMKPSVYTFGATEFSTTDVEKGGQKGESIAGYESDYNIYGGSYGRGAPANGGGGGTAHNAAGGGGANAGLLVNYTGNGNPDISTDPNWISAWNLESPGFANSTSSGGGRGGYSWSDQNTNALSNGPGSSLWGGDNRRNVGGKGGRPLDYSTGRIFLGGGGGAGDANSGAASRGGNGGGIVFIRAFGSILGGGDIISNGGNGDNIPPMSPFTDPPGGGGGGGTILLEVKNTVNGVNLTAMGGAGGDQSVNHSEAEGGGGGGGGGYIAYTGGTPNNILVDGGSNGVTSSPSLTEFGPNGATSGGAGLIDQLNINFLSAVSDSICSGESALLRIVGGGIPSLGTNLNWTTTEIGGDILASGDTFKTVPLYMDTVFYVGSCSIGYKIPVQAIVRPVETSDSVDISPVRCYGDSNGSITVFIKNGIPPYSFTWNVDPLLNTNSLSNLPAGYYSYTANGQDNKCYRKDSIYVSAPMPLDFDETSIISPPSCFSVCDGTIKILAKGGTPPYTYFWMNNALATIDENNLCAGQYDLTLVDNNNCVKDTNLVFEDISSPLQLEIIENNEFCKGEYTLHALVSGGSPTYNYTWSDEEGIIFGKDSSIITNGVSDRYQLTVNDSRGCYIKSELIFPLEKDSSFHIYFPNAITPDGDHINDVFLPKGMCYDRASSSIQIFNRWGELIYETNARIGWDGTTQKTNKSVKERIYIWSAEIHPLYSGKPIQHYKGKVAIVNSGG